MPNTLNIISNCEGDRDGKWPWQRSWRWRWQAAPGLAQDGLGSLLPSTRLHVALSLGYLVCLARPSSHPNLLLSDISCLCGSSLSLLAYALTVVLSIMTTAGMVMLMMLAALTRVVPMLSHRRQANTTSSTLPKGCERLAEKQRLGCTCSCSKATNRAKIRLGPSTLPDSQTLGVHVQP